MTGLDIYDTVYRSEQRLSQILASLKRQGIHETERSFYNKLSTQQLIRTLRERDMYGVSVRSKANIVNALLARNDEERKQQKAFEGTAKAKEAVHIEQQRLKHIEYLASPAYAARIESSRQAATYNSKNSILYQIPREICNNICRLIDFPRYVITNDEQNGVKVAIDSVQDWSLRSAGRHPQFESPVLQTCKLLRDAFLSTYYEGQTLRFVIHMTPKGLFKKARDSEFQNNLDLAVKWLDLVGDRLQFVRFLEIDVSNGYTKLYFKLTGKTYSATGIDAGGSNGKVREEMFEAVLRAVKGHMGEREIVPPRSREALKLESR
ncbi:hypothetical protein LTR37_001407 [Vermiconidia calcicola]|uniref:Uncharacterized protein n=1 Tax=Vermiconidia calcicola TaxID=1690605 RepID=A0ACC3NVH4_9PEZI|nr:hypothetical protein LTR37_001407 [Vermiconidia calcicola]